MSGSIQYHQRCYQSPSKTPKVLPTSFSSTAGAGNEGYEKGGFFTYRGDDTGYFYTATADRLSVFHSNGYVEDAKLFFSISFGPTANVIDCIYFPLNASSPGLVVAVYDSSLSTAKHKSYLAYVSLTKKRVLKKIAAPGQVNSLANIIDGAQYPSQVGGLNSAFRKNWPHIIGVSIYGSGAALTHLGMTSEEETQGEHCHKPTNVIILGKTYLNDDDTFLFQDDQGRKYAGKRMSQFYVSTFAFIEKCAVVIMGFPFGGIYMVSLRTQRPYAYFMAEGVIEGCAIQNADDDPRGFFYLWFTLSRGEKAHCFSAYAIFSEEEEKNKVFDNPQFVFGFNFTLTDYMSFLSVKTMHIDRARLAGCPKDADVSGNESTTAIVNNKSSSLALFTWLSSKKPTRIYGALFDLNMFYYKRTPSRMIPDGTTLAQIPFISGFQTDESIDITNMEIFDISLMPSSMRAFVSVENEDKDQLFYPSVYSFSLKALTRKTAQYLTVDSIQDQYLKEVSMNFVENWLNPSHACTMFHALGIGQLPYESNDKRFYQLSTLLKHSYHFCISNFILEKESTIADLKFLHKWLKKEIEVNKDTLDRSCQPLLDGAEVSESSMRYIQYSEYLSYRICQLIESLIARVKEMEDEEIFLKHLKVASSIANGIFLYSIGIKFGLNIQMLPQPSRLVQANQELKKCYNGVNLNVSGKKTHSLIKLIQECMESSPNDAVWENKTPQEWYPPEKYSTWLGFFLMVNLSKTAKATLFGYYLYDLVKNGLWQEDKLLDKSLGYFLTDDNEKLLAIKRRIEKMYKADEQILREATVMEMDEIQIPQAIKEPKTLEDCRELPLMNQAEIETAKAYFLKLPYGIHYWNKAAIQKRRYELITIPDAPTGPEPSEIADIREEVSQIQFKNPWVFRTNRLESVVKEWVKDTTSTEPPRKAVVDIAEVPISRKRTIDEVIDAEEDAFQLATPIKQGRKSIFADTPAAKAFRAFENGESTPTSEHDITMSPVGNKDIDNKIMSNKQWERIKQITATPPATPLANRLQWSPVASAVKQPTSILKSNKKQSRITASTKRVRLQFDENISQIKSIPNRHEQKTPVPDAFTMDDSSIISEVEHQEEDEVMEVENDQRVEEDEYGPVKLNFDAADDEEILPPAAAVEVETEPSLTEDDEEELPSAVEEEEGGKEANAEEIEKEVEDYEAKNVVIERSFEAQDDGEEAATNAMVEKEKEVDDDKAKNAVMERSFEAQSSPESSVEPEEKPSEMEKPVMESVTEASESNSALPSKPVEPPQSPRRGRPRKSASRENSAEPEKMPSKVVSKEKPAMEPIAEAAEAPKSPRRKIAQKTPSPPKSPRRGRARKSASRENSVEPEKMPSKVVSKEKPAIESIAEAAEPPQSPRRGRPRKSASRENSAEPEKMPSKVVSKEKPAMESIDEASEPPKSPRRRVTQKTPSPQKSPRRKSARKTPSRESSAEPEKKTSRMSRIVVPKEKPAMESITEAAELNSAIPSKPVEPPKSPRRGRARKVTSRETSVEPAMDSEPKKKLPRMQRIAVPEPVSPRRSPRLTKR